MVLRWISIRPFRRHNVGLMREKAVMEKTMTELLKDEGVLHVE